MLKSVSHAREILRRGRSSSDCPTTEHIVLQAGIIGELPHREGPVAEHALNKANDVFALQLLLRMVSDAHKIVLTPGWKNTIL